MTSMPDPLPSLLMMPALVLAALEVLVEPVLALLELELELLEVLVVPLDPVVVADDVTEETMFFLYLSGIDRKMDNLSRT